MDILNDPRVDVTVDATTKGIPARCGPLRLSEIGRQGWNLLTGDCPLPLAVIRTDVLAANSRWMMTFARSHQLQLAPHGKTTMAPQLFARQMADGAWGITVATTQQLEVCLRAGIRRIILANQPIGQSVSACFQALRTHGNLELFVLADSIEGVRLLARGAAENRSASPLRVLVEVGAAGARTGCRDIEAALTVAKAIATAPGLLLAGIEAFEGVLHETDAVSGLMRRVIETASAIDRLGLFFENIVLTAGGSEFFDLVAAGLEPAVLSRPIVRVLRSGCYLTHDDLGYAHDLVRVLRERRVSLPPGELHPALQVWCYVQSRPDPEKVILTLGKRDVGYDIEQPQPISWFRPGHMQAPEPIPAGSRITALNDQHAHMSVPVDSPFEVGDMIVAGIAHPCTTFERWQVLMLADEKLDVVGAVRTFF